MFKRFFCCVMPAKLWRNFGYVTGKVYRSGQMGPTRLMLTWLIYKWDVVIGLNFDPEGSWKERFERWFYRKVGVETYFTYWAAFGPNEQSNKDMPIFLSILRRNDRPKVLVHCAGGVDRTFGLVGEWIIGTPPLGQIDVVVDMCGIHRTPAKGWLWEVFKIKELK